MVSIAWTRYRVGDVPKGVPAMFFVLSKIFWLVVQPLSLIFLLALAGGVLVARRRVRAGLIVAGVGVLLLGVSSFTTLGFVMIRPLEDRFARPAEMPQGVSTIIMLGGATVGRVSAVRGITELNDAGDRLMETLRLARLYPDARVLVSGGSGALEGEVLPEAEIAARLFIDMGIDRDRLMLEDQSRNTDENADLTRDLLGAVDGQVLLVTSAFHMPRSVGLFRKAGLSVIPWPTDYRSTGQEGIGVDIVNPVLNFVTTGVALKEWIGLLAYWATGRIDSALPGPEAPNGD
ncbi:YdcF family protein [Devosia aquimaris]|uniref:YdcF family protein n=1 Tax=Devosia aquimaris TaxID=2866214 RepID=UPI001CD0F681|nr:YdcF family protein [Devosia sp. CJK-A8-3]